MGPGFGARNPQKIVCLAMCGIHLGPLRYLSSSSLLQQYFQVNLDVHFFSDKNH